jgi:hypothetical protein
VTAAVERAVPDAEDREQANAQMRDLLSGPNPGPAGQRIALLHFTGRRSGRRFVVPAGIHELGGRLVVATGSGWRHNFAGGADGELTWRGRRGPARFRLVDDVERVAAGYLELVERYGPELAQRRLGIVLNVDRTPTLEQLRDAVSRCGLALVEVQTELGGPTP